MTFPGYLFHNEKERKKSILDQKQTGENPRICKQK
jgi:hypothetical protein